MSDTAGWLASNGIGGPVDYYASGPLLARRQAAKEERDAERAEERRLAGLEEARDQRLTAQYLAGVVPGSAVQRALALQNLEGEIATRQAEIDKLARRRDRLVEEARDQAELASRAAAMVQRQPLADGVEGAVQRAELVAREVQAEARVEARLARRAASRRARPFGLAARSGGGDVPCQDCLNMGATPEESFLIHNDPQPMTVPDDGERSAPQRVRTGRGTFEYDRDYGEITRITDADGMGQASNFEGRLIFR